jgi:chorismate mutase
MRTNIDFARDYPHLIMKLTQLIAQCDASCLKSLSRMSVHEFVAILNFYCKNNDHLIVSKALMMTLFAKAQDGVADFNELQLTIIKKGIETLFQSERAKYDGDDDFASKVF